MNDRDIQGPPAEAARPRLLDLARETIRRRHYSYRTEQAYLHWMKRFILFSGKRHPRELGAGEVRRCWAKRCRGWTGWNTPSVRHACPRWSR